jgi:hypothetical protein
MGRALSCIKNTGVMANKGLVLTLGTRGNFYIIARY